VRGVTRPMRSVSLPPPPLLFLTEPQAASTPLEASVRPVAPALARNVRRGMPSAPGDMGSVTVSLLLLGSRTARNL
jgi:hypothetical protein